MLSDRFKSRTAVCGRTTSFLASASVALDQGSIGESLNVALHGKVYFVKRM